MKNPMILLLSLLFSLNSLTSFSQVSIGWVARYNNQNLGYDVGLALTVDNNGNVYVTGNSYGNQTRRDLVVLKYSPAGANLWTKRIADTVNNDYMSGSDIAIDVLNNVVVGGTGFYNYDTNGSLLWSNADVGCYRMSLDTAGNFYAIAGQTFYITRKISPSGVLLWEEIYPEYQFIDIHVPRDICTDREQNILITGRSREPIGTLFDYATLKYSNAGNLIWERRYNGGNEDQSYAITCDDSNNVYVTGWNRNSSTDMRTIKYSPDGDTIWQAVYDGGGFDVGYDIEVDSLGNVYVGGVTNGNHYITIKYDISGSLLWSRVQPSEQIPYSPVLKLDKNRNVYMSFVSFRPGPYSNYAVVKYNNDGVQQWIGEYNNNGNANINYIYDMTVDSKPIASIYVTGKSGGSIATVKFVQTPTEINPISNVIPDKIRLEQNYPNPFNPVTTISYDLPNSGFVMLKVYDMLGREIKTLVNEMKTAGHNEAQFTAEGLASGAYFYRLSVSFEAGEFVAVRKCVVVK